LAGAKGVSKCTGRNLRFLQVGRDADVRSTDELLQFRERYKSIVKDDVARHAAIRREALQFEPIGLTFARDNVGMRSAKNNIYDVWVVFENLGQRFNNVFDAFIRRQQAKGKQDRLSLYAKLILVETGIDKRNVGQTMGNHVDLLRCVLVH